MLICLHLAACFWYFTAKLDGFGPDTWVVRYDYRNSSDADLYMTAFYWALTTPSTVGYGDIGAVTMMERILCCIWIIFSVFFFSYTVSNLTAMLSNVNSREAILTNKLLIVDTFAKDVKLSKELRLRLKHALKFNSEKTGFSWADK